VRSCKFQLDKRRGDKAFIPGERLRLPKLGDLNVIWSYSDITVFPNSATVSRNAAGQWFVSLQCDCVDAVHPPQTDKTIGLDLGLSMLIATSDGQKIKPRRFLKNSLRRLRFAQRRLAKASKGGNNRRKHKSRVARIHQRIANKRANFLHGLSTSIVGENQAIAIEDLNVRGIMANGKLARSVGDCGWYELRRQLTYKAKWYGRQLNIVPRFQRTTGVCPDCGAVGNKLLLSVRAWTCEPCDRRYDRDIAAAQIINLMGNTVRSTGIDACGLAHKPEEVSVC
jgi:putative transposase